MTANANLNSNLQENQNIFNLPSFITASVNNVDKYLPDLLKAAAICEPNRQRNLRSDRIKNVCKVLKFLITHYDAVSEYIIAFAPNGKKINYINDAMIKKIDISRSTFYECLNDLRNLGFYHSDSQKYNVKPIANLNVCRYNFFSVHKTIPLVFFQYVGTLDLLKEYKQYLIDNKKDNDTEVLPQFRQVMYAKKYNPTSSNSPRQLTFHQAKTLKEKGELPTLDIIINGYDKEIPTFKELLTERLEKQGITLSEARRLYRIEDPKKNKIEAEIEAYGYTLDELNKYSIEYLHQKTKEGDQYFSRLYLTRLMLERRRRQ